MPEVGKGVPAERNKLQWRSDARLIEVGLCISSFLECHGTVSFVEQWKLKHTAEPT